MYCTRRCELKEISKNCGQWEKETRLGVVRWRENKTGKMKYMRLILIQIISKRATDIRRNGNA